MKVSQNLLEHALGASIRIGDLTLRTFLGDRHKCRIAVYGCGRTEHNALAAVTAHHIAEDQGSGNVVVIIFQWLVYRLTNSL